MKKTLLISMLLTALFINNARASVDISLGGTAWYNWWQPAWRDGIVVNNFILATAPSFLLGSTYHDHHDFAPRSNFMAGPALAIRLPKQLSISSVFVMGRYKFQSAGLSCNLLQLSIMGIQPTVTYRKYTRDILKWDSDTTIGYAAHKFIKVFVGFKAQGYSYDEVMKDYARTDYTYRSLKYEMSSYGTGTGLGFTLPLVENLFLLINASGLVLWAFDKADLNQAYAITLSSGKLNPMLIGYPRGRFFAYGMNSSLALAYYIETISTTISLGGRYQLLFNRQRFKSAFVNNVTQNVIDKEYDYFYGITLSAIYTFTIGSDKKI
jgi:hypothetical protein